MLLFWILLTVAVAYLLGSINFAVIYSKAFIHKDVREFGSGNAGMTNILRVVGPVAGTLTFICDALKGLAACARAKYVFSLLQVYYGVEWLNPVFGAFLCGLACMLGHIYPLFFGFKGGKGVAISVGIFAVCCPVAIISGLVCFLIVLAISRIISISSLLATVVVVTMSIIFHDSSALLWPQAVCTVFMGALVFIKHRENIVRLARGEEKKLTVKKG